jgi:hypothetical protein
MNLRAFIDDSGSGGDSPWYVLAGYVATTEEWNAFNESWTAALHELPRIDYFNLRREGRLTSCCAPMVAG